MEGLSRESRKLVKTDDWNETRSHDDDDEKRHVNSPRLGETLKIVTGRERRRVGERHRGTALPVAKTCGAAPARTHIVVYSLFGKRQLLPANAVGTVGWRPGIADGKVKSPTTTESGGARLFGPRWSAFRRGLPDDERRHRRTSDAKERDAVAEKLIPTAPQRVTAAVSDSYEDREDANVRVAARQSAAAAAAGRSVFSNNLTGDVAAATALPLDGGGGIGRRSAVGRSVPVNRCGGR